MNAYYREGYAAGTNMETANPYPAGTMAYNEWARGNDAAMYGDEYSM